MKTYNKTHIPEQIVYKDSIYKPNAAITSAQKLNNTSLKTIAATLKKEGRKMIVVNCLSNNLKGRTDLHGQPYKPSQWIYTTS